MTNDERTVTRARGCGYWLLTAFLAIVAMGMAVRAVTLPPELAAQVSLSLPLEFVAGIVWAVAFVWATWRLIRGKCGTVSLGLTLAFATYSVLRLFIFARADYDRGRLPFLWVTLALILLAGGFVHAATRRRDRDELRQED